MYDIKVKTDLDKCINCGRPLKSPAEEQAKNILGKYGLGLDDLL